MYSTGLTSNHHYHTLHHSHHTFAHTFVWLCSSSNRINLLMRSNFLIFMFDLPYDVEDLLEVVSQLNHRCHITSKLSDDLVLGCKDISNSHRIVWLLWSHQIIFIEGMVSLIKSNLIACWGAMVLFRQQALPIQKGMLWLKLRGKLKWWTERPNFRVVRFQVLVNC